jgi:hypothetical protein
VILVKPIKLDSLPIPTHLLLPYSIKKKKSMRVWVLETYLREIKGIAAVDFEVYFSI